jgi:translation initiation factor 2 subunit 2
VVPVSKKKFVYSTLLDRVYKIVPHDVSEHQRFEIPKIQGGMQGNMTIISNFKSIADTLRRSPQMLLKFFSRELATAGNTKGGRGVFQGKFTLNTLNDLLKRFTETYVICGECHKPDTKILKEGRFTFIMCEACGAKDSVRTIK